MMVTLLTISLTADASAAPSNVSIQVNPPSPRTGQSVMFTASGSGAGTLGYVWSFGDSSPDSTANPAVHAFAAPGQYNVVLTVTDTADPGAPVDVNQVLNVALNGAPTVGPIGLSPATPCPGQTATATVAVQDEDPASTTLAWNGGAFGSGFSFTVPASAAPSRAVTVQARDGEGNLSAAQNRAIVVPAPSLFASGPFRAVLRREPVTFTASATSPVPCALTYAWDLDDDGTYETPGPAATTAFQDAGVTRTVRALATDGANSVVRPLSVTILPNQLPSGKVSAGAPDAIPGEEVTLRATDLVDRDGDVVSVLWDVDGDGTTDRTGSEVRFTARAPARAVTARIVDDLRGMTTATVPLQIHGAPVLGATRGRTLAGLPVVPFVHLASADAPKTTSGRRPATPKRVARSGILGLQFDIRGVRRVTVRLRVSVRLARRLGLRTSGPGLVLLASGSSSVSPSGAGMVTATAARGAERVVARLRRATVTAELSASDGYGKGVTTSIPVVLMR